MARALTAVAVALLVAACGDGPGGTQPPRTAGTATVATGATPSPSSESSTPAVTKPDDVAAACGKVETYPVQGGSHLVGDQEPPVPYSSTPPTSGWHSSGAFEITVQAEDDPLSEPEQVRVLEAGGAVVSYRGLARADRRALAGLASSPEYRGRIAVTPYEALERGEVAVTVWGKALRCTGPDLAAIRAFVDAHVDPEPGDSH